MVLGPIHNGKIDALRTWIAAGAPREGKVAGVGDLGVLRDPEEVFNNHQHPLHQEKGINYTYLPSKLNLVLNEKSTLQRKSWMTMVNL